MDKLIEIILNTDDALLAVVADNIWCAYVLLFLIVILETGLIIFPFLPGDGLLFSAGVVAASTDLNVWILLLLLIVAAILGNLLNYWMGHSLGTKLRESNNHFTRDYVMKHLPKAQGFYDQYGDRAIILGRFFPIIRTYIPFLAGVVKMEPGLFRKNTVIGAIAWVPLFLLTGFFVGEIMWVKNNYGLIFLCLIVITLIPFLVTLIKMTLKR